MQAKPPFKDSMGRWRTQSLFKEFYLNNSDYPPVFTLKEGDELGRDGESLPSMRKMFLSYNDPTGYKFATAVLGSYEHWRKLCALTWFKEHLNAWLEELEIKLMSEGLVKVKEIAISDSAQSLAAAKYLIEKGWEPKKGRPKKEDIERAARQQAGIEAEVEEDLQRIRIVK